MNTPRLEGDTTMEGETGHAHGPPAPHRLRVLLVDEDKSVRASLRRALRLGGIAADVEEAADSQDAAFHLTKSGFDCALISSGLADTSALTLLPDIRKQGVRTPIIIVTKRGDESRAAAFVDAGATDCLPKSLATPKRLTHAVHNALRIARAERTAQVAESELAHALQLERRARDEAESAQRRLAFLAEASAIATSTIEYGATLSNVARLAVPGLADWCFVDLVDEGGGYTRMAVAHADATKRDIARRLRRRYSDLPDAPHGISRVLATGRAEVMNEAPEWLLLSLARDAEHLDLLRELRASSVLIVPLVASGRILGALTLISHERGRYTLDDVLFTEEIARRAALAVENARLFDQAKKAEERLRHQLDFTTAITGSLAEGVCALDRSGRIAFVNPAAESILRYDAGELLGRTLESLVPDPAAGRTVLSGDVVHVDDGRFSRKDGESTFVSYSASPIVTDGDVIGTVLVFHDTTSRRRAEAELDASRRQLAQSEKLSALGTLVSGVAHELRTPLTYLTNNIYLLQARIEGAGKRDSALDPLVAEVRRYAQAAMEGVERINSLVRDLRPFATTESGRRVETGLHDIAAVAVDLFRATQRGRVDIDASLEPTPTLLVDKGQLQRVVINLLLNAAEAMPRGGRIRVRTTTSTREAILSLEDEGEGIPLEVEARIFDPFYTTKPEGTGLGLAITRRIVESHGGTIRYRTERGKGTTFVISIPFDATTPPKTRARRLIPAGNDEAQHPLTND